ncbi:MAG: MFS transporter [Christensenellaceae bacterium]
MVKRRYQTFFIVMSFLIFVLYAFYKNIYGADAPVMMDFYSITNAQQGFILTTQSIGGMVVAVILALNGERYNKINVITLGMAVLVIACIFIGLVPPYVFLLILSCATGIGVTMIDVMMNGVISEVFPEKKNTLLPITHAFYGLGCMAAPLLVAFTVNPKIFESFGVPFLIIGVAGAAVFVFYLIAGKKIMKDTPYVDMESMKKRAIENPAEVFKTKPAWVLLLTGILYFCFQIGIASWLPTYCIQNLSMPFEQAGAMLTAFFGGALIMRFLCPLILKKMSTSKFFIVFGLTSALCMIAALSVTNIQLVIVLAIIAGFLQGANVVALVIMCCDTFPKRTASASAIVVFAANAATMLGPVLIGEIASVTGFRFPMYLICGLMLISILCIFLLTRKKAIAC